MGIVRDMHSNGELATGLHQGRWDIDVVPLGDTNVAKAYSHPIRAAILDQLKSGPQSPSKLARAIDKEVGLVSYHVRYLRDCKMVALAGTRQVRGATEHTYKLVR
jgi:DNA-binding transcriptional ArsR family regulator